MPMRVDILGVPIDAVTLAEAVARMCEFANSRSQRHIATPNPEMLVEARKNPAFLALLRKTDLNLPDGAGLLWAAKRQGTPLPERVTGVDTLEAFAKKSDARIFLLGAAPGIAEEAANALRGKNPARNITGAFAGSPAPEDEEEILSRINTSGANALFVAFGAPKQDLWIARNLAKMPNITLAMGVGGAFDFLAGKRMRAPQWMRAARIEWLWRLLKEPSRIGRIFTAVVVFPYFVVTASRHATART